MSEKLRPENELANWQHSNDCKNAIKIIEQSLGIVEREGINKVRKYLLEDSDYINAPASGMYHGNKPGGLLLHSIKVMQLFDIVNDTQDLGIPQESVILCGLLHDICKCNLYKRRINKDGSVSSQYGGWERIKENDYGHGAKSVLEITKIAPNLLTKQEESIIYYHMYCFDYNYKQYEGFIGLHPEIKIFFGCDIQATGIDEMKNE